MAQQQGMDSALFERRLRPVYGECFPGMDMLIRPPANHNPTADPPQTIWRLATTARPCRSPRSCCANIPPCSAPVPWKDYPSSVWDATMRATDASKPSPRRSPRMTPRCRCYPSATAKWNNVRMDQGLRHHRKLGT